MKKTLRLFSMLWAGTESSFDAYCVAKMNAGTGYVRDPESTPSTPTSSTDPDPVPALLTIDGPLAIVTVHGTLTNEDNWWNEFAGLVSYNDIRAALYYAGTHQDKIKEVLLDVSSPGGTVYGVMDAAQAVANLADIMPVTMFSDSVVASGAYWSLAAPAAERYISPVATAGSIGVLFIHQEYSQAAAEAGFTFTVFRSGKYKALGNSVEPLSETAKKEIQEQVAYTSSVFEGDVAEYLEVSAEVVASQMGQGRTFIGQQAVDVGLVDGISNFDDVVAAIHARIQYDEILVKESGGNNMKKKKLSLAAFQALAASGADLTQVDVEPVVTITEPVIETPATVVESTVVVATPLPELVTESQVVALLKEQLKEKETALFEAMTEVKDLKAKTGCLDGLKKVAAMAINNMLIALGGTATVDLDAADAGALLAQHVLVSEKFTKEFKVGGVGSAEASIIESPEPKAKPTRMEAAQSTKVVNLK